MGSITLSDILEDLRSADQALRKFEQRYWLSSDVFYELYSQGLLDNGSRAEDFAEWAGHYKLKLKRESALNRLSRYRLEELRSQTGDQNIDLTPQEPVVDLPECLFPPEKNTRNSFTQFHPSIQRLSPHLFTFTPTAP